VSFPGAAFAAAIRSAMLAMGLSLRTAIMKA
jgi:hypothetical protein